MARDMVSRGRMVNDVIRKTIDQVEDETFATALRTWNAGVPDTPGLFVEAIRRRCDLATNIYLTDLDDAGFWAYRMRIVNQSFSINHTNSFTFGDYPDRRYFEQVVQPCFQDLTDGWVPVLHRIKAKIQGKLAVYERLALPTADHNNMKRSITISKLLALVEQPDKINLDTLSRRERQCLSLLAAGYSAKRISAELQLSQSTVENHIERMKNKLAVRSVAQATAIAALHGDDVNISLPRSHASFTPSSLSGRERQCLGFLASGLTVKEIADRLQLSAKTVEVQVAALKRRLAARNVAEAVAVGIALAFD